MSLPGKQMTRRRVKKRRHRPRTACKVDVQQAPPPLVEHQRRSSTAAHTAAARAVAATAAQGTIQAPAPRRARGVTYQRGCSARARARSPLACRPNRHARRASDPRFGRRPPPPPATRRPRAAHRGGGGGKGARRRGASKAGGVPLATPRGAAVAPGPRWSGGARAQGGEPLGRVVLKALWGANRRVGQTTTRGGHDQRRAAGTCTHRSPH